MSVRLGPYVSSFVMGLALAALAVGAEPSMRSDRLLVKITADCAGPADSLPENRLPAGIPQLDEVATRYGVVRARAIARAAPGPRRVDQAFRAYGLDRLYVLELPVADRALVERVVQELAAAPCVEYAEPVFRYRLMATVPNDPLFPLQWAHENTGQTGGTPGADMSSTLGWDLGTGSPSGVIGILDTGVDLDHPDLAPNLIGGFDFSQSPEGLDDHFGHGTQVTGNAAARGNNARGVAGVCWRCSVLTLKVFGSNEILSLEEIVPAVIYGAESGADVLNMSFGELAWSQAFADAVHYAASLGTLSLAASGNAGVREPLVPAALHGVISVAGTTHDDERLGSYGDHAEIAAPTNVTTTWPNGQYFVFRGTSGAVPFAAGLAALLRAEDPTLHVQELRQLLRLGAADGIGNPNEDTPGWDSFLGYGRIDVARSMELARGPWLAFDRPHYVCGGTLFLDHKDPRASDTVTAMVTGGRGGDVETVTLFPVTAQGYYRGSLAISQRPSGVPPVLGDGKLDIVSGETATARVGSLTSSSFFDCAKRVCLDQLPELAGLAADCDADGVLDPGESWSFEAGFDNDQTELLDGVRIELRSSAPLDLGAAIDVGPMNPVGDRMVGPFSVGLAPGAPVSPPDATMEFDIRGTGFESDTADCAAQGFPAGFSVQLDRDGDVPDTWRATPPESLAWSTRSCPRALELSWATVAGANAYAVHRSELSCADAIDSGTPYATVGGPSFVDEQAAPGVTYHYAVAALESGTTCVSHRSCVNAACPCVAPADPTGLHVTRVGPDLWLEWDDPSTAGVAWNLYRAGAPEPGAFGRPLVAGLVDVDPGRPGIQFADGAGAAAPGSFFCLVTAVNGCGESPLFTRSGAP